MQEYLADDAHQDEVYVALLERAASAPTKWALSWALQRTCLALLSSGMHLTKFACGWQCRGRSTMRDTNQALHARVRT